MTPRERPHRVCLIVDNPLRDLDGLLLVAWQLSQRGVESYLVPMYDQGFDVAAIAPDLVVANYLRSNNADLLTAYKRRGARIAILDTEGQAGKTPEAFAALVAAGGGGDLPDRYFAWGQGRYDAMRVARLFLPGVLKLTGCPRYDFAVAPWRAALPAPSVAPGYVLVNTNFPAINPRFSHGRAAERQAMLTVGFASTFVDEYIRDVGEAFDGMTALMAALAARFPAERFVLRPHPFEGAAAYAGLAALPNFEVRQEGTSLEWLASARLLIHLNCSTAVEAAMLGCEPLSPSWLNRPAIHLDGPTMISRNLPDIDAVAACIAASDAPAPDASLAAARADVIRDGFLAADGGAAERVADELVALLGEPLRPTARRQSGRGSAIALARGVAGPQVMFAIRDRLLRGSAPRRAGKSFEADAVRATIGRIAAVAGTTPPKVMRAGSDRRPRLATGRTLCIAAHQG